MKIQEPDQLHHPKAGTKYRLILETMDGEKVIDKPNLTAGVFVLLGEIPETWQTAFGTNHGIAFAIAKSPFMFAELATKVGITDEVLMAQRLMGQIHK